MSPAVAHPRALALFRLLLVGVGTAVTAVVVAAILSFLLVVGLAGTLLALVVGDAVLTPVVVLLGVAVLVGGSFLAAVGVGLRRLERAVTRADRVPTPVEAVRRRYVAGELDETGLERALETALGAESSVPRAPSRAGAPGDAGDGRQRVELESAHR